MNPLDLPASDCTPAIRYDSAAGVLRLDGESYPEDVVAFYGPVVTWLREHLESNAATLKVQFALRYLNTSSTKAVLDLISILDEHHRTGRKVEVEWFYDPAIEVMREAGEEMGEDSDLPFSILPLN
jgi:hypothetical protein